ncbi:MAG: hypothetical protein ACRD13_15070 [Terriglobales bacterium]
MAPPQSISTPPADPAPSSPEGPPPDLRRVRADLDYIRHTLEQAGTFSAVSGAGVIIAGIIGCIASACTVWQFGRIYGPEAWRLPWSWGWAADYSRVFLLIWVVAVIIAAPLALWALYRKSRRWRLPLRGGPTGRALRSMAPGWLAAALLTAALAWRGAPEWLAGTWLLLAGLALLSAASFSIAPVRWLGRGLAVLGVVAFFFPSPLVALVCLALGFGLLHLLAGWRITRPPVAAREDPGGVGAGQPAAAAASRAGNGALR